MSASHTQFYHHGRFLVKGGVIPDAVTAYRTYGHPSNPCIVFPTCYGAKLDSQLYLVGNDKETSFTLRDLVLDPEKYFVVTFALFSNGESSSPSNTPAPYNGPYFPQVSYQDNIRAQYAVLTKKLAIQEIFLVIGFSMGGQQAYHWPVIYPEYVNRFVSICSSARTSPHNQCFLEGLKATLTASKGFDNGHYKSPPEQGLRAFGRVYSGWAYGQTWYRDHGYLHGGLYPDLNSFICEQWEENFVTYWDANDLLALLATWQSGDISLVQDEGDLQRCLGMVKARGLIMPCKTDLYFPPEDNEIEVSNCQNTIRLVVIDSVWGHMAGGAVNPQDIAFISSVVKEFLEET